MHELEKLNPNARGIFEDAYVMGFLDGQFSIAADGPPTVEDGLYNALNNYFKTEEDGKDNENNNGIQSN